MDTADARCTEDVKMEIEMDRDFSDRSSDEMHAHADGKRSTRSCRRMLRSRPRLQSTKSFPPYSQSIGGFGEDMGHWENELISESEEGRGPERKEDVEPTPRHSREEQMAKWRTRRKGKLVRSSEVDTDGWERGTWCGRVEEAGREGEHGEDREGEGQHQRGGNSTDGGRKSSVGPEAEGQDDGGSEAPARQAQEPPGPGEGSMEGQRSAPHPIFSKLYHSSISSTYSSNFSSAESDEVYSEGENASSKRKAFRKCRWKTYMTMMHWSLQRQSSWVQLAGHQGNLQLSEGGEVLKLYSEVEAKCLDSLMRDPLKPFVPQYHGLVTRGEHSYIRMEDLLSGLRKPVIMDCKMGVRTYQEEELIKARTKSTLRKDMYQKMLKIDPLALSAEEHREEGVTKWRYLQWRDTTSSTSTLGFRIEGIMMEDTSVERDFRKIQTQAQVTEALLYFTRSQLDTLKAYHSRLLALSDALKNSTFFRTHEVIGSSLLFVHDHSRRANVWMIDFGKTNPVPCKSELQHNVPWAEGSREDGYLIGLASLITSLSQAISVASWEQENSSGEVQNVVNEAN